MAKKSNIKLKCKKKGGSYLKHITVRVNITRKKISIWKKAMTEKIEIINKWFNNDFKSSKNDENILIIN